VIGDAHRRDGMQGDERSARDAIERNAPDRAPRRQEEKVARPYLLQVEKKRLMDDGVSGLIDAQALEEIRRDLDARLFMLEGGEEEAQPPAPAGRSGAPPASTEGESAE
jgi:hypothetical protein